MLPRAAVGRGLPSAPRIGKYGERVHGSNNPEFTTVNRITLLYSNSAIVRLMWHSGQGSR